MVTVSMQGEKRLRAERWGLALGLALRWPAGSKGVDQADDQGEAFQERNQQMQGPWGSRSLDREAGQRQEGEE